MMLFGIRLCIQCWSPVYVKAGGYGVVICKKCLTGEK